MKSVIVLTLFSFFQLRLVLSALDVDILPKSLLEPSGSTVMLRCQTSPSSSDVIVVWEKDNVPVPLYPENSNDADSSLAYALSNNTLFIKNLKRRLTGTYICKASLGSEKRVSKAVVEVAYLQKFDPMVSVRVYQDSPAKMICPDILGKPTPTLSWYFNGKLIPGATGQEYSIPSASLTFAGDYTCVATNTYKVRNVTGTLEVIIPGRVEITPESGEIFEGKSFDFNCQSKAKPPLPVQWKRVTDKVEKEIINTTTVTVFGGKLSFKKALPSDKGVYKCFTRLNSEDESATARFNVAEYLKIDENMQKYVQMKDVRQKTNVISCAFQGDGEYSVSWIRLNSLSSVLPSNMKQVNDSLVITDLKFEDAGKYQCQADGISNTAIADVTLKVFESTKLKTHPKNVTADVGQPIWIDCVADGNPTPKVSYMRNDEKGSKPLNVTHFKTMENGTLHISSIQLRDAGPYLCWLSQFASIGGSVTASFYINVNDPVAKKESGSMVKTIAIAVGCAGVYILLVIGLMIYCKARRARLMEKGLVTEVDPDDNDYDSKAKEPLLNEIPLQDLKQLDNWEYNRNDLVNIETLGHGKMGRVFKANAISGDDKKLLVAVKEFENNGEEYTAEFNLEIEMFAQLKHENVVRLIGVCTDKSPFYIITEFCEKGDLKTYLRETKDLSCQDLLNMAYGIASGMEYLIALRYMHRDLAARNCIAFADKSVKVSFLSLCEDVYKDDYYLLNQVPVPLRWLSPEAILAENYSEKSDVWSFGVTIWEIFANGAQPYGEYDNKKVQLGICKDLRLPKPVKCPVSVYEVMQKCWILDVAARPNFNEITSLIAGITLENTEIDS